MPTPKLPEPPFNLKDLMQPMPVVNTALVNTPEEIAAMRDRAGQDLTDIAALQKNDPFNRFYIRRIRQKRDQAIHSLIYDKCDAATREGHRQKVIVLEEAMTLLEDDDAAARGLLG